jgi:hypothetical protein
MNYGLIECVQSTTALSEVESANSWKKILQDYTKQQKKMFIASLGMETSDKIMMKTDINDVDDVDDNYDGK